MPGEGFEGSPEHPFSPDSWAIWADRGVLESSENPRGFRLAVARCTLGVQWRAAASPEPVGELQSPGEATG